MPYTLEYLKSQHLYEPLPGDKPDKIVEVADEDFTELMKESGNSHGPGKVRTNLPKRIRDKLITVEDSNWKHGDKSRQDADVITAMLNHGMSREDTYATFAASPKGEDTMTRGKSPDYIERTITKAEAYVKKNGIVLESVEVVGGEDAGSKPLVVSSGTELLQHKFPKRPALMVTASGEAVFHGRSVNEIHSWRGVGKTAFSLGLSSALAGGEKFLGWHSTQKFNVLYVDGELPGEEFQERVRQLIKTPDLFKCITSEQQPDSMIPSISSEEGRKLIEQAVTENDIDVIILDSISTLANITTNDEDSWLALNEWFRYLRNRYGLAVFYLHHDGKSGTQRGHSKHEDITDKVVHLQWEGSYTGVEGLRCTLLFEKARQPIKENNCIRIELVQEEGKLRWRWTGQTIVSRGQRGVGRPTIIRPEVDKYLRSLFREGLPPQQIFNALKDKHGEEAVPSLSTIKRRVQELAENES